MALLVSHCEDTSDFAPYKISLRKFMLTDFTKCDAGRTLWGYQLLLCGWRFAATSMALSHWCITTTYLMEIHTMKHLSLFQSFLCYSMSVLQGEGL